MRMRHAVGWAMLCSVPVILVLIAIYQRWGASTGVGAYNFLFGGAGGAKGLFELALGAITVIGGGITVYFLFRRAEHDSQLLELSQFKEAATLMGSANSASNIAGMALMTKLARLSPQTYAEQLARTLIACIEDRGRSDWEAWADYVDEATDTPPPRYAHTNPVAQEALLLLSQNRYSGEHLLGMTIDRVYFGFSSFSGLQLQHMAFVNCVFHRVAFNDCDLRRSVLHILLGESELVFEGRCDLRRLEIEVTCVLRDHHRPAVRIGNDCLIGGTLINGVSIESPGLHIHPSPFDRSKAAATKADRASGKPTN